MGNVVGPIASRHDVPSLRMVGCSLDLDRCQAFPAQLCPSARMVYTRQLDELLWLTPENDSLSDCSVLLCKRTRANQALPDVYGTTRLTLKYIHLLLQRPAECLVSSFLRAARRDEGKASVAKRRSAIRSGLRI